MLYNRAMELKTFGGLRLEGSDFQRTKALLVLCYLSIEGQKERKYLARLFWPEQENALGNLAMTLTRLRKAAPAILDSNEVFASTSLSCDSFQLNQAFASKDWSTVRELYRGNFLEGLDTSRYGVEVEEWVYEQRELFAAKARHALINLAEEDAKNQQFTEASLKAEQAYQFRYAPEPEAEDLKRLYLLLQADQNLNTKDVQKEAKAFGLTLSLSQEDARALLIEPKNKTEGLLVLPSFPLAFIGRANELKQISDDLRQPNVRLLTILAQGGMGKTRLAIEAGKSLNQHFSEGVCFTSFISTSSAEQIPFILGETLNYSFLGSGSAEEQIHRLLKDKEMLLIMDNLEHLENAAIFVNELLLKTSKIKILATSRESLNLQSERILELKGLHYSATAIESDDAVKVFLQAAQNRQPTLEPDKETLVDISRLCQLVAGMPLALELSASWLRTLSLKTILTELEKGIDLLQTSAQDLSQRHQSIRAVFDYSWQLLSTDEQTIIKRLSVFRGGFNLEAAKAITGTSLTILARLIDKSFLSTVAPDRYRRHPLVIQYAQEKFDETPEEKRRIEETHGRYFLELIRELSPKLRGLERKTILDRLEPDFDNVKKAWFRIVRKQDAEAILQYSEALSRVFSIRIPEGCELLDHAVSALDESKPEHLRALAYALVHQTGIGISSKSSKRVIRGFEILKRLDDKPGMAIAVSMQFDYINNKEESSYIAALDLCREYGRPEDIGEMLHRYLLYCRQHGEFELVQKKFESAIEELRRLDIPMQLFHTLITYGAYLVYNKNYQEGMRLLEESANLSKKLAFPMIAVSHCELGYAKFKLNEWDYAEHYLQESLEGFKALGLTRFEGKSLGYLSRIAIARKNQHEAAMYLKRGLQIIYECGKDRFIHEALIAYADYLKTFGSISTSVEVLKYIADSPLTETRDRGQAEELLKDLKKELPETVFQEAQEKAKILTLEQITSQLKQFQNALS